MSIKLNIQLVYRYFQKNQCLNITKHGAFSNCSACPCVNMALSLLIHFQYICISTYTSIWFNVMYLILISLCLYAGLNKLEERGNDIQVVHAALRHVFTPLNSSKRISFPFYQHINKITQKLYQSPWSFDPTK